MLRRTHSLFAAALLAVVASPVFADGATGKWNLSVETPNGPMTMVFDLVADGAKLSGTMNNEFMGAMPLSDGSVKGNQIAFKLKIEGGPNGAMTIAYTGEVKGDAIALTSKFEGALPEGAPAEQQVTLTRVK